MIKFLNVILFCGMVVMNYLANALPLNNKTTGQLSDTYPNLFVPAGITFSIWGVIYLLLAIFCILQFTPSNQTSVNKIGWAFALSCLFNALWIVCWHFEKVPLSLVVMTGLFLSLIYVNAQLASESPGIIKAAFGIYLGWICIATIANVTALLVFYKWNGLGIPEQAWTIIMILAGACIAILAMYKYRNPFIGLSVIWAFTGIIIKRQHDYRMIVLAAAFALVVVAVLSVRGFLKIYGFDLRY